MRSLVTKNSVSAFNVRQFVRIATLVLGVAIFTGPLPAHAQLGKLKKMGADAVKDKAKEAAGVKNPETTPPTGASGARVDYAITEARLSNIMEYLAPLVDEAEKQAAGRDAMKSYKEKFDAANACINKGTDGDATPDLAAATSPKAQALMDRVTALSALHDKATSTKNYRGMAAYADTMAVGQITYAAMMFPSIKCPAIPYKPAAILDMEVQAMMQGASGGGRSQATEHAVAPALRVGMTTGQFGRIRERMAVWLLIKSGDLPATSEKFTDEEQALLTSKIDALKRYGPLFNKGVMQWATWGDITAW